MPYVDYSQFGQATKNVCMTTVQGTDGHVPFILDICIGGSMA